MNIILTGASKGIGKSLVYELGKNQPHHILMIARNEYKLKEMQDELKSAVDFKSKLSYLVFDLSHSKNISEILMPQVFRIFQRIDILINNAGYLNNQPFEKISPQEFKRHYEINVFSPFELIKKCKPLMKDSAIRHIVNIGTLGAIQGRKKFAGLAAYSSSKAALANLTELLHEELKEDHICINYLALGAVNTDMFTEAFPEGNTDTSPKEMASYIARFALNEWKNTSGKLVEVVL